MRMIYVSKAQILHADQEKRRNFVLFGSMKRVCFVIYMYGKSANA